VTGQDQPRARTHNLVTIQGNNSGNIASGNRDVTQTAVTQSNLPIADITQIMKAVVEVAGSLRLADRDRDELVRTAHSMQYELEATDLNEQEVITLGSKVVRLLGRTTSATAAALPGVLIKYLEYKLGIGPSA
jgi:hypothetical protein